MPRKAKTKPAKRSAAAAKSVAAKGSNSRGVIQRLNPPSLYKPSGYTHVVISTGARTIYVAGQVPNDKDANIVGQGDFRAQAVQVFENLKAALAAAGASFADVVKINTYVLDMSNIATLREVRTGYLSAEPPASTLVQVGKLAHPDFLLEIELIAVTAK